MLFLLVWSGSALAQPVVEPPDGDLDLVTKLPFHLNMDTDEIDWEEEYTFFPFEGAVLHRIENPDATGINETGHVLEYEKVSGGMAWAGFFYLLEEPALLTETSVFRLKVWSPRADITALLKLEMSGTEINTGDLFVDITEENEWVQLEWDLGNLPEALDEVPWDLVVIILDLDVENPPGGGANDTWYLDDFHMIVSEETSAIETDLPRALSLHQNYPNPFNPTTTISFDLPETSQVTLEVYNMLDMKVATLSDGTMQAGTHSVSFDASNLASGVYLYRLQAGDQTLTRQLTLIK